jgi:dGTPase
MRFQEALRRLIDTLVGGLIEGTAAAAQAAGLRNVDDVRRHPSRVACFSPRARSLSAGLKAFLHRNLYASKPLLRERERVRAMLAELFQFYLERPDRLPPPYGEQAAAGPVHRVVCDYIAGMTDGFFRRTYRRVLKRGG